jgi:hypothetical protein
MKNELFFAPLQYRYSLLSDKNMTIGLLFYEKNTGNISFFEAAEEIKNLTHYYPKLNIKGLNAYYELIQDKIKQNPPLPHWEKADFQAYIYRNILRLDDTALQFESVASIKNEVRKKEQYLHSFLPLTYPNTHKSHSKKREILTKFDVLNSTYSTSQVPSTIRNEVTILENNSFFKFNRVWKSGTKWHFLLAMDFENQNIQEIVYKLKKILMDFSFKADYQVDVWANVSENVDKKEEYLNLLNQKFSYSQIQVYFPEQWVEYVKGIYANKVAYNYA